MRGARKRPAETRESSDDAVPDHEVIQEAKDAGGYVFSGGLDGDLEPVVVAGDGTATDGTYQQTKELSVLRTAAGDRDLRGPLQGRLP